MRSALRNVVLSVLCVAGLVLVYACTSTERDINRQGEDLWNTPPAKRNMSNVMHAKLVHAQAIVEAVVLGDDPSVASHARLLLEISNQASWMVQDTQTYFALSDDFRSIVNQLAVSADAKDTEAVREAYVEMLDNCLRCHTYLRRERMGNDLPGDVSAIDRDGFDAMIPAPGGS